MQATVKKMGEKTLHLLDGANFRKTKGCIHLSWEKDRTGHLGS